MTQAQGKVWQLVRTGSYDCSGCAFELDVKACLCSGGGCLTHGGIFKEMSNAGNLSAPASTAGGQLAG